MRLLCRVSKIHEARLQGFRRLQPGVPAVADICADERIAWSQTVFAHGFYFFRRCAQCLFVQTHQFVKKSFRQGQRVVNRQQSFAHGVHHPGDDFDQSLAVARGLGNIGAPHQVAQRQTEDGLVLARWVTFHRQPFMRHHLRPWPGNKSSNDGIARHKVPSLADLSGYFFSQQVALLNLHQGLDCQFLRLNDSLVTGRLPVFKVFEQ